MSQHQKVINLTKQIKALIKKYRIEKAKLIMTTKTEHLHYLDSPDININK